MVDYDLPMLESDLVELRSMNFIFEDADRNELIKYLDLFEKTAPITKVGINVENLGRFVIKIQALARGFLARQIVKRMRGSSDFKKIQE